MACDTKGSSLMVSWMAVDSHFKCISIDKGEVPLQTMLVDAVSLLKGERVGSQCELFAAKREGSWLSLSDAITFGRRKPEELALYMTASSALKMNQLVSIFQYAPSAESVIHLIIKEPPKAGDEEDDNAGTEPVTKKQRISQLSLHQLAGEFTPSSFAKPSGRGGWVFQLTSHADQIECHRVTATSSPPLPLVLLHPVFGQVHDDCQSIEFGANDCSFVVKLSNALARSDHNDKSFASAARSLISTYLGVPAERDGTIVHRGRLVFHVVCKAERGGGDGDPTMRNIAHYLKHLPSRIDRQFPCFLLDLCGPFMTLFGMCNTSAIHAVCEPLTLGLPTLHFSNELLMVSLVRTWASLKKGVATLIQGDSIMAPVNPTSIAFPYKNEYTTANGETVDLSYSRRLTRQVFEAWYASHGSHIGGLVIVKLSKRYNKQVHDFCHAQGFAPKLLHHERIGGGWIFLVMEKVEGLAKIWSSPDVVEAREQLEQLKNALKTRGFVHGDLRETNVMWSTVQRRIVVLDFDWSGKEGEVRYPPFMNRHLPWPPGAATGELITADHDRDFLDRL